MKDLPHHMKKLNRRVIRSERRLEEEDVNYVSHLPTPPSWSDRPKSQLRKQAKAKMRKEREAHIPSNLTPEERSHKMRNRVPIFDRISHEKPKMGARPPRKQKRIHRP